LTAADIVASLGAQVARTLGDLDRVIATPAPLDAAEPDSISFCRAADLAGREAIEASRAGTIICGEIAGLDELAMLKTLIVVAEPRLAFIRILDRHFGAQSTRTGIHPTATVGAFSYVGVVEIGPGTVIHPRVTIHDGARIGRNVVVWGGTVIGLDGFGYHRNEVGQMERFPHVGGVVIEDDVEIGANSIVARGALGDTVIRRGAKIDCFVHVAHNVVIGEDAVVVAHAMLGGSVRIGDRAWIAPCACIRDVIEIGDDATVGLGAVVVKNVPPGMTVMGAPAREAEEFKRLLAQLKGLSS
jgi:UDP-3-O-[3-hydroxymyristoyl] glucosamine N-acyltransferase